jgi:hypothetical protein
MTKHKDTKDESDLKRRDTESAENTQRFYWGMVSGLA